MEAGDNMRCMNCSAEVPNDAFRCPGCGLVQVAGEGLDYHQAHDREFRAESLANRPGRVMFGEPVAGRGRRLVGWIIDGVLLGIPATVIATLATNWMGRDVATDDISSLLVLAAMHVFVLAMIWSVFEGSAWNATPGKKILGMRVVDILGNEASYGEAFGRNFARFAFLSIGILAPLDAIWIFFNDEHETLHDRIAGTRVVDA